MNAAETWRAATCSGGDQIVGFDAISITAIIWPGSAVRPGSLKACEHGARSILSPLHPDAFGFQGEKRRGVLILEARTVCGCGPPTSRQAHASAELRATSRGDTNAARGA